MTLRVRGRRFAFAVLVFCSLLLEPLLFAANLGEGELLIRGAALAVSPESQTVPFETPTVVQTSLVGFDATEGSLPASLRVVGELSGPEISGTLTLETSPGEPFRIPAFHLDGEYLLEDIRLLDGQVFLGFAEPRSAVIRVTQILVTQVTSRALTLEEIQSHGIVVTSNNLRAYNFTFGFAVAGQTITYDVPVVYSFEETGTITAFALPGSRPTNFSPPRLEPFVMVVKPPPDASGGCPVFDCTVGDAPPLPGVLMFPAEFGLLNQFFSVVLLVQNGAPEGDPLVVRDLTAKIRLPQGLRAAETLPPTPLGVPVPVRVPGPDGEVGTSDDLTFLIAQAKGEAEFSVEGLREGTHVVTVEMQGLLEGLPGGLRQIEGEARGAVVVRDPTFALKIGHPDVVRSDQETPYSLYINVTNTSNLPANLVRIKLPVAGLSGVEIVGEREQEIETLLPGDSEVLEFRVRALRTGRVVATFTRVPDNLAAVFELRLGVGEAGIPLSPDTLLLPSSTALLPSTLTRAALRVLGLAYSSATASPSQLPPDAPRVSRGRVDGRVAELAEAAELLRLGADRLDVFAELLAKWMGVADGDFEWDRLRRITEGGARFGVAMAPLLGEEIAASSASAFFERLVLATDFLPPVAAALVEGEEMRLEVSSRMSGKRLAGAGTAGDRLRDLPFAELLDVGGSELAVLSRPEASGYRVVVRPRQGSSGGSAELSLTFRDELDRILVVEFPSVSLQANGSATAELLPGAAAATLVVDANGDGFPESTISGSVSVLPPRPFELVGARQNADLDPTGHVVDLLFSHAVDRAGLFPVDADHFTAPRHVSNGGVSQTDISAYLGAGFEGLGSRRYQRILQVVFNNSFSPYLTTDLTATDLVSSTGAQLGSQTVPLELTVTMPGTAVEGQVLGPDGLPVPFARVDLVEVDYCPFCDFENACVAHKTAAVQADANGEYFLEYVRQTSCSDLYDLTAHDPVRGLTGEARNRVRFIGQTTELDIVLRGEGTVRGRVLYDDGSPAIGLPVSAISSVYQFGKTTGTDVNGNFQLDGLPVGPLSLLVRDRDGNFAAATLELGTAGAVVERNLVILRQSRPTGELRGRVFSADGTMPVSAAYLALRTSQGLIQVVRSGADGSFDFGLVPAGEVEILSYSGETGREGARTFLHVTADQVTTIDILLVDERGAVEGYIQRQELNGTLTPVDGAVVWIGGTPFNTRTDSSGYYRLEDVFAGLWSFRAADPATFREEGGAVTVLAGETVRKDLLLGVPLTAGGIAGVVLDENGLPVPGAVIHRAIDSQHWQGETATDGSGQFLLQGVTPGRHTVHAIRGTSGATAVGEVRFAGDIPFVTVRFIRGTIRARLLARDEFGNTTPVVGTVRVRKSQVEPELGLVAMSLAPIDLVSGTDGWIEEPNALAGPYLLTATNPFYGQASVSGEISVQGQVREHEIIFNAAGAIAGVVYDYDGTTPVEGARVDLRHPLLGAFEVETDEEGRFLFEGIAAHPRCCEVEVFYDSGLIFRQAKVEAQVRLPGQRLEVEVVLPAQGSVSGRVEDANGSPVAFAQVTLAEAQYPMRRLTMDTDADGGFFFRNIFAGTATVSAVAPALGGLGGKVAVELSNEGEELDGVVVRLADNGEIRGRVLSPIDGSPVPNAEVRLHRANVLFEAVTSDNNGEFSFILVPLATYEIRVIDQASGRTGRETGVALTTNGQVVSRDVVLEGRGVVEGHVYEPSFTPVPGASVALNGNDAVFRGIRVYTSSDVDGFYRFEGIPEGDFTVNAREIDGRRRAFGSGTLVGEDTVVTVDLFLEESGVVEGTVRTPVGLPDGPFTPVQVTVEQDARVIGSSQEPTYRVSGLIAGRDFFVRASEPGGRHGARAVGRIEDEGQVLTLDVRMVPIGSVEVTVEDSNGAPVVAAEVDLSSQGFYQDNRFIGSTGTDHVVTFPNVGAGNLTVFVTDPISQLRGSKTGVLTSEGELVRLTVTLQASGEAFGVVRRSDGISPAPLAFAVLTTGAFTYRVQADDDGAFRFPSVPLGNFVLDLSENLGPGERRVRGNVAANGAQVDVGVLALDDFDPTVLSVSPVDGSIIQPVSTPIVVTFSEPIDIAAFSNGSSIRFTKLGSIQNVLYTASWSDGGATATLTPNQPLASFTTYQVRVNNTVVDLAGRNVAQPVATVFTTADVISPSVVTVEPAAGAVQVSLASQVRFTFSEPIEPESLSGAALQLTDLTTGSGVTTTFQVEPTSTAVVITPVGGLTAEHYYSVTVQGVRDRAGNVMLTPFTASFRSLDPNPPLVEVAAAPGPWIEGIAQNLIATQVGGSDLASVTFTKTGGATVVDTTSPYQFSYTPTAADATAGAIEIQVTAKDLSNNLSTPLVLSRAVAGDPPPTIALTTTPELEVLPEQTLAISAQIDDATGISEVRLILSGALTDNRLFAPGNAITYGLSRSYTLPVTVSQPQVVVTVRATDQLGKVSEVSRTLVAGDFEAPALTVTEPAEGAAFTAGDSITARATASDNHRVKEVVFRLGALSSTDTTAPYEWATAAPSVESEQNVVLEVEARDFNGNSAVVPRTLVVSPLTDPGRPQIAIACPSPGALLVPGIGLDMTFLASDDEAVERVDVYVGEAATPTASLGTAPYVYRVQAPVGALVGDLVSVRAVVFDFGGNSSEVASELEVIDGVRISSNISISNVLTTYENQTVVVTAGTTQIDGAHTFTHLVVVGSAKVVPWIRVLNLTVTGRVYVGCNAAIDGTARGYNSRVTYDNTTTEGAALTAGGSFGGQGGGTGTNPIYGSVFEPLFPGSGGGFGVGGGALRLAVAGEILLDGSIQANGGTATTTNRGGGSGGSIYLLAAAIEGVGILSAHGGSSASPGFEGGGGRIALYSDALDPELFTRSGATGAGAGTIFTQRSDQLYGELLVDGGNAAITRPTPLPAVGRGTIASVTANSLTDPLAVFRHDLAGVGVVVNDQLGTVWPILSHPHKGQTLTLDVSSQPFAGVGGDTYQGLYRFDRVTVRNGAFLTLADRLEVGEAPVVEEGSLLSTGDPAAAPQVSLSALVAAPFAAGQTVTFELVGASVAGIDRLEAEVSGAQVGAQLFEWNGESFALSLFTVAVPVSASGQSLDLTLIAYDPLGRSTSASRSFGVVPDGIAPLGAFTAPAAGTVVSSGSNVAVTVTASDNVSFTGTVALGEMLFNVTTSPQSFTFQAPPVTVATELPIRLEVTDPAGNVTVVERLILVQPVADAVSPQITTRCVSNGALILPGETLPFTRSVSDNFEIYSIRLFAVDGLGATTLSAQSFPNSNSAFFSYSLVVPAELADGDTLSYLLRITDVGGQEVEEAVSLKVITGTVVSSNLTLAAGDLSLEGQNLILVGGRLLTVEGPHTFGSLLVKPNATVTHQATTATTEGRLALTLTGDLYLGCGTGVGTLDVAGKGYLGGTSGGPGKTYPNVPATSSGNYGGSHGGVGGELTGGSPAIYGSVFAPDTPGAGGGSTTSSGQTTGGRGGGVVKVMAAGNIVVDGLVTANGVTVTTTSSCGAGGSVLLSAAGVLGGGGQILARGADSSNAGVGEGGGGRVALYGSTVDPLLLSRVEVAGGHSGSGLGSRSGSAGTLFVKRDTDTLGELIFDNENTGSTQPSGLPEVGTGVIDAVTADSLTDFEAAFPHSLAGAEVALNFDYALFWPIVSHAHLGQTLTLSTAAQPFTGQPGDSYRGAWRFDRLTLRGNARVEIADLVILGEPASVAPGSTLHTGNLAPPVIDAAKLSLGLGVFGVRLEAEAGAVSDPDLPLSVRITNTTTGGEYLLEVATDGSFGIPIEGEDGDSFEVVAIDSGLPVLESGAVTLGPLSGDLGARLSIPARLGDSHGELLATCDSCRPDTEVEQPFNIELYRLTDPLRPEWVSAFSLIGEGVHGTCEQACAGARDLCGESGNEPSCLAAVDECDQSCGLEPEVCTNSCDACWVSCDDALAGPECFAACDACYSTCENFILPGIEIDSDNSRVEDLATENGVVVFTQGQRLRVVDARDPAQPVLVDTEQSLQLTTLAGTTLSEVKVVEGYAHTILPASPHTYFVVDVHDPQHPRLVAATDLAIRDPADLEVRDGRLHVLSKGSGTAGEVQVFAVGDPAQPLPLTGSVSGTLSRQGSRLALFGDVGVYGMTNDSGLRTFHLFDSQGAAPRESTDFGLVTEVARISHQVLAAHSAGVTVGSLDPTLGSHDFTVEATLPSPVDQPMLDFWTHGRMLWVRSGFAFGGELNAFRSFLLEPWLDRAALTVTADSLGATLVGGVGAALGADEAVATAGSTTVSASVALDGSFSLVLPGVERGERVELQARDLDDHGGNVVERRVPLGLGRGFVEVAGGVARLAVDGTLAAALPVRQGTNGVVALIDLEPPTPAPVLPIRVGEVTLTGTASDVALYSSALYVAGASGLQVYDLTDPAAPVAVPSLDLFGGTPVAALARAGTTLLVLGGSGAGTSLRTLDLSTPLAPTEVGGVVAVGALTAPRLVVHGTDLWLLADGLLRRYSLTSGTTVLAASGSWVGRVTDLEVSAGGVWASVRAQGVRSVAEAGGVLTLGAAPSPAHHAFGLFTAPALAGERLWWAEGLGGVKTWLRVEEPLSGSLVPVEGRHATRCLAYDGTVVGNRLLLSTDCGLETLEVTP